MKVKLIEKQKQEYLEFLKKRSSYANYTRLWNKNFEWDLLTRDIDHCIWDQYSEDELFENHSLIPKGFKPDRGMDEWNKDSIEYVFIKKGFLRRTKYHSVFIDLKKFFEWAEKRGNINW